MGDLAGQVIVVTGGTGGLGRWVIRTFVRAGGRVHVPWRTEEGRTEVATLLRRELEPPSWTGPPGSIHGRLPG